MFYFGSGPIRGFAVVLMIGIVTSVFTAVNFTRMLVAAVGQAPSARAYCTFEGPTHEAC